MRDLAFLDRRGNEFIVVPMLIALVVRFIYHLFDIPDFWGDAHHNLIISQYTVDNQWVYSDYKGREVVWLPFYRYLTSALMTAFGRFDFLIPHWYNMIMGALTCGLVAVITARETDRRTGAMAGILLALLPWHIAYSHMNMPEITGSVILLLAIHVQRTDRWYWLIPLTFAGVLTRNELGLYLGFFGLYVLYVKDWKSALSMVVGGVAGILIWGNWNLSQTGNFFWWITERSIGSGWDKIFYRSVGRGAGAWYMPFLAIVQVFPLIVLVPYYLRRFRHQWGTINRYLLVLTALVLFNWLFVMVMNLGYFPSPDARYFILTLPVLCIVFMGWIYHLDNPAVLMKRCLLISVVIALFQLPTFYFFHYPMNPAIEQGKYIRDHIRISGNWWNDFPVATHYSNTDYRLSFSSTMLAPKDLRGPQLQDHLAAGLRDNGIEYVLYQEVPYSYVPTVWPQMKEEVAFDWEGIHFEPVYIYRYEGEDGILQKLRKQIEAGRTSSLWRLTLDN